MCFGKVCTGPDYTNIVPDIGLQVAGTYNAFVLCQAMSLKRKTFHFDLPRELIAQNPLPRRSDSRLLQISLSSGDLSDRQFRDLPGLLNPGDLLVFNDTRVIPARLFGRKESGGRVEVMLERLLSENECLAQLRVSKASRI